MESTVTIHLSTNAGPMRIVGGIGTVRKLIRELTAVEQAYLREKDVVPAGGNATVDVRKAGEFQIKG